MDAFSVSRLDGVSLRDESHRGQEGEREKLLSG